MTARMPITLCKASNPVMCSGHELTFKGGTGHDYDDPAANYYPNRSNQDRMLDPREYKEVFVYYLHGAKKIF